MRCWLSSQPMAVLATGSKKVMTMVTRRNFLKAVSASTVMTAHFGLEEMVLACRNPIAFRWCVNIYGSRCMGLVIPKLIVACLIAVMAACYAIWCEPQPGS